MTGTPGSGARKTGDQTCANLLIELINGVVMVPVKKFCSFLLCLGFATTTIAASISPMDSNSAIETRVARVIKEQLLIETSLETVDAASGNIRVRTLIAENKERGNPKIATYIDTAILVKKKGQVANQIIIVFSIADIGLVTKDRLKLLEWANNWNSNFGPIRVQITADELITSASVMVTSRAPVEEDQIVDIYLTVTQSWPGVVKSLRKQGLLAD